MSGGGAIFLLSFGSCQTSSGIKKNCSCLTFSSLTLHCHLHPLQAANCCRNSRLVVDEDDFK